MKNHSTLVLLCKRCAKIKNKNRKPLIKNDLRFFVVTRVGKERIKRLLLRG